MFIAGERGEVGDPDRFGEHRYGPDSGGLANPRIVVAMGAISLTAIEGGFTLDNYARFFTTPSYRQAMVNSLEVTAIVTVRGGRIRISAAASG